MPTKKLPRPSNEELQRFIRLQLQIEPTEPLPELSAWSKVEHLRTWQALQIGAMSQADVERINAEARRQDQVASMRDRTPDGGDAA